MSRLRRSPRGADRLTRGRGTDRGALLRFTAFALVTGLITVFIGQQILGTSFEKRYTLRATFADVTGLLEGDLVKISGAPVGRVDGIEVERGMAVVRMRIDDSVRVPDDSTAAIRWRNVVGQRLVYLVPGKSTTMLGDGAKVRHTQSVVDLGEIVNAIGPLTQSLDPDQLNKVLNAFAQSLDGNADNISLMMRNLDALLSTFQARKQTIARLTDDYATVSEAVAQRDRQIAASVDNLQQITEVFADNRELLDGAVVEIAGVTRSLNEVLGGNERQLARLIQNLTAFTETARINIDQLEKMVQNLPLTMRQLFASGNGGRYLRSNALCLNVVQGPCPFEMRFPKGNGNGDTVPPPAGELAKLERMLRGDG